MLANDPDRDWERWGKTDPYFGVLTDPKFLDENLNDHFPLAIRSSISSRAANVMSSRSTRPSDPECGPIFNRFECD